ncbi:hypothetical protein [Patulibacter sp. SYSU D01012]|uniref:hypothetical protein n=1 Tax=Patulibacter sp. SYSU D01012 TaxID=2817381 RepID=UPI001B30122D|nr:hypothetical protein [Patulibacter sp. SYSU D01012]
MGGGPGYDPEGISLGGISRAQRRAEAIAAGQRVVAEAVATENLAERMLLMVAAVGQALEDLSLTPTVVGGLVVEYFTRAYATSDVDVLLPTTDEVKDRLHQLGFVQPEEGQRVWRHPAADIEWEMPGSDLSPEDQAVAVELAGGARLLMLRREDMLVHRIDEFVGGGHREVFEQVLALAHGHDVDWHRVRERAAQSNLHDAVDVVLDWTRRVIDDGEPMPETWALHDLADDLGRQLMRRNAESARGRRS